GAGSPWPRQSASAAAVQLVVPSQLLHSDAGTRLSTFSLLRHATFPTVISTLSLHYALPISVSPCISTEADAVLPIPISPRTNVRSEEHTSELQSQSNLVCRRLLDKNKPVRRLHPRLPGRRHEARNARLARSHPLRDPAHHAR